MFRSSTSRRLHLLFSKHACIGSRRQVSPRQQPTADPGRPVRGACRASLRPVVSRKIANGNESRRIEVKDSPGAHRLLHETGSRSGSPLWCMGARQRRHRGRGLVSGQGGHRAVVDQSGRCAGNRRLIDAKARQRAYELGGTLAATGDLTLMAMSNHKRGSRLLRAPATSVGRLIIR